MFLEHENFVWTALWPLTYLSKLMKLYSYNCWIVLYPLELVKTKAARTRGHLWLQFVRAGRPSWAWWGCSSPCTKCESLSPCAHSRSYQNTPSRKLTLSLVTGDRTTAREVHLYAEKVIFRIHFGS